MLFPSPQREGGRFFARGRLKGTVAPNTLPLLELLRRGVSHLQEIDRLLVFGGCVHGADPEAVPAGLRRGELERAGLAVGSGTNERCHLLSAGSSKSSSILVADVQCVAS